MVRESRVTILCVTAAFAKAWDITLVVLAVVPILLIVAAILSIFIERIQKEQSEAYGQANSIALEALAAVRTVLSFNGEARTVQRSGTVALLQCHAQALLRSKISKPEHKARAPHTAGYASSLSGQCAWP